MKPCPCCSGSAFSSCCEPYISRLKAAPTPEALMRSRYTAYSLADVDYIAETMRGRAAQDWNATSAKYWAENTDFIGLAVHDHHEKGDQGQVTFFARTLSEGQYGFLYECSQFERINGAWYYIDGQTQKSQRNDPCPCLSGKKHKKCCGA